jgi:linoleoyl-CoA desaturase
MTVEQEVGTSPTGQAPSPTESARKLTFGKDNAFQVELKRRVDAYFASSGRRQRDCPTMYLKTAILLSSFAATYAVLVFVAPAWWLALPLAILLGLATAGIGFNIQHDGGHQAYSSHPWVNKLMALTLDLIGGSSYLWHQKHGVLHHTYANITGHDTDIDLGIVGRLAPHQKRLAFHRWQHLYLWPLYGLLSIKWHLYTDFRNILLGNIDGHRVPRPQGWELGIFIGGKAFFFAMAFGIPLLLHPFWSVLFVYAVAAVVSGVVMSVVFQLAHCVQEAEFPLPQHDIGRIDNPWAVHQVESTVDFARGSRVASWLLGGLNFQIEHHLFPRICHVNYPAISKLVEETCRQFGVRCSAHRSVWAGVVSHFRWLRQMGMSQANG